MDIKEFRSIGLLQEINRQFLHPMGLALIVEIDDSGLESLSGIQDYRDDPEGMAYLDEMLVQPESIQKADDVSKLFEAKREYREKNLGWHVQLIGKK